MRIIKARDYDEVSRKAANIIFSVMTEKPDCVLGEKIPRATPTT